MCDLCFSLLLRLFIIMYKMRFLYLVILAVCLVILAVYLVILAVKQYNIRGVTIFSGKFELTDQQL